MAAAALARRGVAGVRSTKGLFFILTLLSLLCVARSQISKDQLEKSKDDLHVRHQRLKFRMAENEVNLVYMLEFMSHLERMEELTKEIFATSHFDPVNVYLERMKTIMEQVVEYTVEHGEKLDEAREDTEEKLGKVKKLLTFIEEKEAEL